MRKSAKKITCFFLAAAMAFSLAGCGSSGSDSSSTKKESTTKSDKDSTTDETKKASGKSSSDDVEKPEKITIMVDGTLVKQESGQKEWEAKFEEITGIDLEIIQPDHSSYYDQLAIAFQDGKNMKADAVILSAEKYPAYAQTGSLWDMSEAWENSELKESGRVNEEYIDSLYIDGGLYGFTPARGNGCITYLRKDWLDNLNLEIPTTYDEYIDVLKAFVNDDPDGNGQNDTIGVTASGLIGTEAPYTNYLPEFWQDAYPDYYKNDDGEWVDGFAEDATWDALERMSEAYADGLIDMTVISNKTSDCRDKFYSSNVGVFTYWAGKWSKTLQDSIVGVEDASIVGIPPIKEVGKYTERQSPVWAITSACDDPEAVFKYLFEGMVDGGDLQMLFTYGAEGTHWEEKDGTYTMLPDPADSSKTFQSAHIDPLLSIVEWDDPFADQRDPLVQETATTFFENSKLAPVIVSTDSMVENAADLLDIRTVIVNAVVTGQKSIDDAKAEYEQKASAITSATLEELNSKK